MTYLNPDIRKRRTANLKRLFFDDWNIEHFAPVETYRLNNQGWVDTGLDSVFPPPERLHKNMEETIKLADRIREEWGSPVRCLSGYRPPLYNARIDGSDDSQHIYYRALDLQPLNSNYERFKECASEVMASYSHPNGFGTYDTFVHVDTGYYDHNRRW